MTQQFYMPPLPDGYKCSKPWDYEGHLFIEGQMQAYARQAIELDRQGRGEPVAYLRNLTDPQPHCVTDLRYRSAAAAMAGVEYVPVYAGPQHVEPVKAPSDDDLFAIHDEHFPTMMLGHESYLNFARALLSNYGQPAQPAYGHSDTPMDIAYGHKAQQDADKVDAERYRFLRQENASLLTDHTLAVIVDNSKGGAWIGSDLDAAIDAARTKQGSQS